MSFGCHGGTMERQLRRQESGEVSPGARNSTETRQRLSLSSVAFGKDANSSLPMKMGPRGKPPRRSSSSSLVPVSWVPGRHSSWPTNRVLSACWFDRQLSLCACVLWISSPLTNGPPGLDLTCAYVLFNLYFLNGLNRDRSLRNYSIIPLHQLPVMLTIQQLGER